MIQLRDYQEDLTAKVRAALGRHRRVLMQAPTGSGKTWLIAFMILRAAARGLRVVFVVHRRELLDQTCDALNVLGVAHGRIASGHPGTSHPVQVATIQTLARRVDSMAKPNLVVIDEAHHAPASSYRKVLDAWLNAWVVGLTATPQRLDGRGLDDLFDELVLGPSVRWLTDNGYLAPYRIIGVPPGSVDLSEVHTRGGDYARGELEAAVLQKGVLGDVVEHYREHVRGPLLVYCVSRAHARAVEEAYRAAGVDAHYCAGDTPDDVRNKLVKGFRDGTPPVLVSVDLFGEGLDAPGLAAVQLLRATKSLGLHLQQVGRVLRPEPGKVAMILDHVGNSWIHGLPDWDRDWSLVGRPKQDKPPEVKLKLCKQCYAMYEAFKRKCPVCGSEHAVEPRLPDELDGKLVELDPAKMREAQMRQEQKLEEGRCQTLSDWVVLAKRRGYGLGWAGIRYAVRAGIPRETAIAEAYKLAKTMDKKVS